MPKTQHENKGAGLRSRASSLPGFTYPDEPIRYRIAKNVPTLTKTVTPMENMSLTSSTCLVPRRRLRIVRCQRAAFAADNTTRH